MEEPKGNNESNKRKLMKTRHEIKREYNVIIDLFIHHLQAMLDDAELGKDIKWEKPWSPRGALHANILTPSREYSGLNQFICDIYCHWKGWHSKSWITQKGINKLGGTLLPDQKPIIIYGFIPNPQIDEKIETPNSDNSDTQFMTSDFIRVNYYIWIVPVYNVEQCTGLRLPKRRVVKSDVIAEKIISRMPNKPQIIEENINKAFYDVPLDSVHLPPLVNFKSKAFYYDTLFHELAHSTGHETRLKRKTLTDTAYLCDHHYAEEEIIAEFASVFLTNYCGLSCERIIKNNVVYVRAWLQKLNEWKKKTPDKLVIYLSMAKQASDYILGRAIPARVRSGRRRHVENSIEFSLQKDIALVD